MDATLLEAYNRVVTGCGLVDMSDCARLWATGRGRIDLIHRMSTNDLRDLALGQGKATVLTTSIGRMVDRIVVVNLGERALILGSPGMAASIQRWLSGYIFYNDDVAFIDAAPALEQWLLFGPHAGRVADSWWPGASALGEHEFHEQGGVWIGCGDALEGNSYWLIGPPETLAALRTTALTAGAVEVGRDIYDVVRIEAGRPEYGHEIGEAYIPLEAGLWSDVSFSKGCYIGQEIIARMESRGKLAKTLVGVRAASPLAAGTTFAGGTLTSAAQSPRFGWIGLAYVRPADAEPGKELLVDGVTARVAPLPFRG
jgi:folate-binding protein YgfZ